MALKNLVAQKAKLTEETIEAIISDYVRYDIEEREIVFTPEATALSNKARVLIFLVAQQGWQFVLEEAIDVEVAPSRMEELLGIQGGTLRPILKVLKDRKLLTAKSGKYSIRSSSLDAIKTELAQQDDATPRPKKRTLAKTRPNTKNSTIVEAETQTEPNVTPNLHQTAGKPAKNSTRKGVGPGQAFDDVVGDGFFDNGRTLAQLQTRLHERAIIINQPSLPKYLLKAVRKGRLTRKKEEVNGKQVWVYTTAK